MVSSAQQITGKQVSNVHHLIFVLLSTNSDLLFYAGKKILILVFKIFSNLILLCIYIYIYVRAKFSQN